LIEVIVAMMILTIVSAVLVGAFHTGLSAYSKLSAYEKSSLELGNVSSLLGGDLRKFVPAGDQPFFCDGSSVSFRVKAGSPASRLELLRYYFEHGQLLRSSTPYVDDKESMALAVPVSTVMANGFSSVSFSPIGTQPELSAASGSAAPDGGASATWPKALAVLAELQGGRSATLSFELPRFALPDVASSAAAASAQSAPAQGGTP
jgi:hypothetical protein